MVTSSAASTFLSALSVGPNSTTELPEATVSHMTTMDVWVGYWRYGATTNLDPAGGGTTTVPGGVGVGPCPRESRTADAKATVTAVTAANRRPKRDMGGPRGSGECGDDTPES